MSELLDRVNQFKGLAQTQRSNGQPAEAAKVFQQAINLLEASLQNLTAESRNYAALQLADLYGMLGGTLREQSDLVNSARAYDTGFRYESDPQYGIHGFYNAVNRLLTRVLLCPAALTEPELLRTASPDLLFVNLPECLNDIRTKLIAGEGRFTGYWEAGDLAVVCALLGDDDGAAKGAQLFASYLPPPFAYQAYQKTAGALAGLETSRKESLQTLAELFQGK